jgi:hypothetical protein
MATSARLAPDHQVILHALEVLRLMGGQLESQHAVDRGELRLVLGFLKNTARCEKARALLMQLIETTESGETYLGEITRLYTKEYADVLFDKSRFLLESPPTAEFNRLLYKLESKYIDPHCI